VDIDVSERQEPRIWNTWDEARDDFGQAFRYVAVSE
jgi:hypothetical protein